MNTAALRGGVLATERKIALICLALLLASVISIGAATRGRWFAATPAPPAATAPAPQAGLSLAKEYIYGPGGRILATEEPAAVPSPPSVTTLDPPSGVVGTSLTMTITGSNLSGATSINFSPLTDITASVPSWSLVSGTETLMATVTILPTAQAIPRNVTVTTPKWHLHAGGDLFNHQSSSEFVWHKSPHNKRRQWSI